MFVLFLHNVFSIANSVLFCTGVGNKGWLIDLKAVACDLGEGKCRALLGFHRFTGCDTTSAFVQKGKLKPLKLLHKQVSGSKYPDLSSEEILKCLESFTCLMYSGRLSNINLMRYAKFQDRLTFRHGDQLLSSDSGVDMRLVPPRCDALIMHIKRTNYQAYIFCR